MATLPFALLGGIWLLYWLDYNLSVAVGVGSLPWPAWRWKPAGDAGLSGLRGSPARSRARGRTERDADGLTRSCRSKAGCCGFDPR